jgi:hypothetical protein
MLAKKAHIMSLAQMGEWPRGLSGLSGALHDDGRNCPQVARNFHSVRLFGFRVRISDLLRISDFGFRISRSAGLCILSLLAAGVLSSLCQGGPLRAWHQRADTAAGPIAFGAGTFVSAGADGLILVSTNGQSWTQPPSGTTNHFSRAAYIGNQFICVGGQGTIVTSPDGQAWTLRDSGTTNWLASLTYGNGLILTVGGMSLNGSERQVVVRSADGVTWEAQEREGPTLIRVAFGNGRFVAVPSIAGALLTSVDGMTWATNSCWCTSSSPHEVIYARDQFVAIGTCYDVPGSPSAHISTSSDGLTWTERFAYNGGFGLGPVAYGAAAISEGGRGEFREVPGNGRC